MSKSAKRERQRINREARREAEEQWLKRRRILRLVRNIAIPIVIVVVVALVINVFFRDDGGDEAADPTETSTAAYTATVLTSHGTFEMDLDSEEAPQTVNAFVYEARNGCYDGLTFHRVVPGFVVQGGDPNGDGTGDFGYTLPDEPPADGYGMGTVAMANAGPGTTGSQFFVTLTDDAGQQLMATGGPPYLYSILGQVTTGMETVDAIAALGTGDGPPSEDVTITSIAVAEESVPLEPTGEPCERSEPPPFTLAEAPTETTPEDTQPAEVPEDGTPASTPPEETPTEETGTP